MNRTMFIGIDLYYSQEFVDDRISELKEKEKEIERLTELCNKYEEEHKTTFEEWKKTINIINELEKYIISQMQEQETLKETKAPTYIFCKLQELKASDEMPKE